MEMNWKKPVSLVLSLALAASLTVPALADEKPAGWTPADGVRVEEPWYAEAQAYVTEKGWMIGTDKGFEPHKTVTRAEVYQALWNMEGSPVVAAPTEHLLQMNESLNGILGVWFTNSARWAYREGLTTGTDGGRYEGGRAVTRAELATALYRWVQSKDQGFTGAWMFLLDFDDAAQVPEWADEAMHWMTMKKVINGKGSERTLACQDTATRAELAQMLMKLDKVMSGVAADALMGKAVAASKYGNVGTDITGTAIAAAGFEVGDILKVEITGQEAVMIPFGTGYSNVDTGKPIALMDTSTDTLALAINMGNFAKTYALGTQAEDKSWTMDETKTIIVSMGEKAGYLEEYTIRNIDSLRTNVREDYASDEVFANFRAVTMGDIADGRLYRGSSPVNPELGRNTYVDALLKAKGVKTVIDLADSEEEYEGYEGVKETYAYTTNTVKLNMGVDFAAEDFAAKLKTGLEFMIEGEGPYYIHCTEGKDRCGFVTMVLEMLMGGKADEIVDDYMLSYENYYHVEHDSDRWNRIAGSNVISNMLKLTGAEDRAALAQADLVKAAETYLTGTVGLTADQVSALKTVLSK